MVFRMLLAFLIFNQTDHFAKTIGFAWAKAFARWPIFKIVSFLQYLVFFEWFFPQNDSNLTVELFFPCFWHFYIFTLTDHFTRTIAFAWAIAFARWPIFKIVPLFQYLVFFRSFFFHRSTIMLLLNCFSHVFGIFNF